MALPEPPCLDLGPARPGGASGPETVGNFYAKGFADAWEVVRLRPAASLALRDVTERFVSAFWDSDLSPAVKEAALFNLSTLRSQTFFRNGDGHPLGWEGCLDDAGSCLGSCTHVWNYDLATSVSCSARWPGKCVRSSTSMPPRTTGP